MGDQGLGMFVAGSGMNAEHARVDGPLPREWLVLPEVRSPSAYCKVV